MRVFAPRITEQGAQIRVSAQVEISSARVEGVLSPRLLWEQTAKLSERMEHCRVPGVSATKEHAWPLGY